MTIEELIDFDETVLKKEKDPIYRTIKLKYFLEEEKVISKEKIEVLLKSFEWSKQLYYLYPLLIVLVIPGVTIFTALLLKIPESDEQHMFYILMGTNIIFVYFILIYLPLSSLKQKKQYKRIRQTLLNYYLNYL